MKLKLSFLIMFVALVSPELFARDLSHELKTIYQTENTFSASEVNQLKDLDFYLVPGLLSEVFIDDDKRGNVDFSRLTEDYFHDQTILLKKKYGFKLTRLQSSSRSTDEVRANIRNAITASQSARKKAFFITHSMGGVVLLDELSQNENLQANMAGILFLQAPFYGSPMADIYLEDPFHFTSLLKPLYPSFNVSTEVINYLSVKNRSQVMQENAAAIQKLVTNIPVLTVSGVTQQQKSVFKLAVDIMESGCPRSRLKFCLTPKLFSGPYDLNDGMVPEKSSRLTSADFVTLEGVDHGEMVIKMPYTNLNKERLSLALIKLLLRK